MLSARDSDSVKQLTAVTVSCRLVYGCWGLCAELSQRRAVELCTVSCACRTLGVCFVLPYWQLLLHQHAAAAAAATCPAPTFLKTQHTERAARNRANVREGAGAVAAGRHCDRSDLEDQDLHFRHAMSLVGSSQNQDLLPRIRLLEELIRIQYYPGCSYSVAKVYRTGSLSESRPSAQVSLIYELLRRLYTA